LLAQDLGDTIITAVSPTFATFAEASNASVIREAFERSRAELHKLEAKVGLPVIDCYHLQPFVMSLPGMHAQGFISELWKEVSCVWLTRVCTTPIQCSISHSVAFTRAHSFDHSFNAHSVIQKPDLSMAPLRG